MTSWIALVSRLLLGGVLGAAAVLKLDDSPAEQVRAVRAYDLLPHGIDAAVGYTLPVAELLLALALILGLATRTAAVLSALLMAVFIVGVASAWARGLTIDCGCFGGGGEVAAGETAYPQEILRDVGLLLVAAFLAMAGPGRYALSARLGRGGRPGSGGPEGSGDPDDGGGVEDTGSADDSGRTGSADGRGTEPIGEGTETENTERV